MSVDLVSVESLGELAKVANYEHGQAEFAAGAAIGHAVRAGEALNRAKEQVPYGEWERWLDENFHASHWTAALYRRAALHHERLAAKGARTVNQAREILLAESLTQRSRLPVKQAEARELTATGLSSREVGELMGVNNTTVSRWLRPNPHQARNRRRAKALAAAKALRAR